MSGFSIPAFYFFYQGLPAAGGSLNVYQTGTTTPVTIYADALLITPLSNPLTLDANGQALFYYSGTVNLKLVAHTASGSLIQTIDPVYPSGAAIGGGIPWVVAGGTSDIITGTYSPVITSLTDGVLLSFRANAANTTATPTFSPNGLTASNITASGGAALVAGNIVAQNAEYLVRYNLANTRWELLNPTVQAPVSAMSLLSTQTINSTTPSVSVTSGITSAYSHYVWEISNLTSVNDAVNADITVQQGGVFIGGSNYLYTMNVINAGGTQSGTASSGAAFFPVTAGQAPIYPSTPSTIRFEFWQPALVNNLSVMFQCIGNAGGSPQFINGGGLVVTLAATTGLKLVMSSGNIETCTANLYGIT